MGINKKQVRRKVADWELARSIGQLMWECDDLPISERCDRIRAAGHEPRLMLGLKKEAIVKLMHWLLTEELMARVRLFAIPERVRKVLQKRPTELKRREAAAKRGLQAKCIYSSLLREPDGGQGYLVFRTRRMNRCIVYMLEWTSPQPVLEDVCEELNLAVK